MPCLVSHGTYAHFTPAPPSIPTTLPVLSVTAVPALQVTTVAYLWLHLFPFVRDPHDVMPSHNVKHFRYHGRSKYFSSCVFPGWLKPVQELLGHPARALRRATLTKNISAESRNTRPEDPELQNQVQTTVIAVTLLAALPGRGRRSNTYNSDGTLFRCSASSAGENRTVYVVPPPGSLRGIHVTSMTS